VTDVDKARKLRKNAAREALIVLAVVALALAWTVGYCYLHGYRHAPDSWAVCAGLASERTADNFEQVAGLPDWVFFGILVPWLACTAFTVFFCLKIMKDDDLGGEREEGASRGH
jgi:hypothetical protein